MKACGETITDLMLIEKIMRSLPQKFDHIVVAIEESRDLEKLKVEELQSSLEAHKMRMSERNPIKLNEQALKVQHSKSKGKKKNKFQSKETHLAQEESDSKPLILMVMTTTEGMKSLDKGWYLDSGCSNHMTCNREWLVNFDNTKKSKARFADDNTLMVEGMGDVIINRKNGSQALISNVLFVPGMKCNLLSIGQLVEKGYTVC
ncbi:uncharacterized protein LOC124845441 [Vigna umbellata]|uniref:uncharacterized protein LOC124845441 n=1 Tax=Vigna umbellata TaxID=87088 RepID=UPI001F5E439C|nr:uncharacterized protein LOC124845441 [Vigna umbellata]